MKKIIVIAITFFMFCKNCMASTVVMDMDNNRVLYENNKDEVKLIASTTKIMTALLALESNRVEEIVTVGDEVLSMYGSNIYIEKGEEMPLLDLIYGLMLRSGNDASVSIAKFVSGSIPSFVNDMNKKAQSLGMTNTKYENDTYPWNINDNNKNINLEIDTSTVVNEINDNNSKLNIKINTKAIIIILVVILSLGLIGFIIILNKIRKANKI